MAMVVEKSSSDALVGEAEVIVTPEMILAGRGAFDAWMRRWDYLADGLPGDDDVSELLAAVFETMNISRPSFSK
jgi:hypothetical protein